MGVVHVRRFLFISLLVCVALALPTAAIATLLPPRTAQVTGTLTATGAYSFTVQTPGRPTGVINALARAANKLAAADLPYVWGGGHAEAGVASVGVKGGPGYNGRRRGFDCSGSVAAVLAGAGLWPAGAGVPDDAGVISFLRQRHEIASGAGTGPLEVTLYDDPGVHIFMNIAGRFFGTSDGGAAGNRRGGPGWLDDGAPDAYSRSFHRYHFLPSVLRATTTAGYTLAFQFSPGVSIPSQVPLGAGVRVVYRTTSQGTMVAQSVTLTGERLANGTVASIASDGSAFTVTTRSGRTLSFPASAKSSLVGALLDGQVAVGDTVTVAYVQKPALTVISVEVTGVPTPTTTTTTPTTTTPTTTTPTTTTSSPGGGPGGGQSGIGTNSPTGGQGIGG